MLAKGFVDGLNENEALFPQDDMEDLLIAVHEEMQARMVQRMLSDDPNYKKLYEQNLERSRAFHADLATKEGVITLDNGIQYKVLKEGTGKSPSSEDTVLVDFDGRLIDGTEVNAGDAVEFEVDQVIKGGQIILPMMKEGARWQVALPPEFAFGAVGNPPIVGPNETLIVDVELLEVR
jgi:FKBP-type peptidyl-prolyl cis-trans isomerase